MINTSQCLFGTNIDTWTPIQLFCTELAAIEHHVDLVITTTDKGTVLTASYEGESPGGNYFGSLHRLLNDKHIQESHINDSKVEIVNEINNRHKDELEHISGLIERERQF